MENTEKELLKELGIKVQKARKGMRISQSELAKKTGMDRTYISMVERGITNITFLKLKKISDELGMSFKI